MSGLWNLAVIGTGCKESVGSFGIGAKLLGQDIPNGLTMLNNSNKSKNNNNKNKTQKPTTTEKDIP